MRIDIATLFPEMCEAVLGESIIGRARKSEYIEINCHQIRDYSTDKHRRVDDTPYGGGMGMVMQCEPIYRCWLDVCEQSGAKPHTIYMSPKGTVLDQKKAVELSKMENIMIICGHYEGVDQRILDKIVVARMCPGVLADAECYTDESIYSGLLEYPQYTRPEIWEGEAVPEILLSGHHKNIADWRHQQSLELTKQRRPDLYEEYAAAHPEPPPKKKRRKKSPQQTEE